MTRPMRPGKGKALLGSLRSLWPQVPLGSAVILAGVLNIIDGQRYPAIALSGLEPLLELDSSLWALGSGSEVFLGGLLVLVGLGLLWRLSVAWSFAWPNAYRPQPTWPHIKQTQISSRLPQHWHDKLVVISAVRPLFHGVSISNLRTIMHVASRDVSEP